MLVAGEKYELAFKSCSDFECCSFIYNRFNSRKN